MVFGIRLLRVFMGHILMDGTATWWLDGHIGVLGRLLLKFSRNPLLSAWWWGMGREFVFGKIFGGVSKLCALDLLIFIELFL